ncbi:MAG TPA: thiosulfate oxidation carrier complex protein SoxZ [Acidiferrobacteraceae bacterium]|nr:thiosulfate oxidation carrier complex protein SoxZ [Acidiferrobacteraceae bacterium]
MARKTKVRTRMQDGKVEVLILITHPMETGLRSDKKTKQKIPAHFIQTLDVILNGEPVANAELGIGISTNPLLGFRLNSAKTGDKLQIKWKDNKGESGTINSKVDL